MRKDIIILLIFCWILMILFNCSIDNFAKQHYIPQPGMNIKYNKVIWTKKNDIPSPFLNSDGSIIDTSLKWETRRELIKKILEEYVYDPRPTLHIKHVEAGREYPDYLVSTNAITYHAKIFYDNSRWFNVRITRPSQYGCYPVIIRYEDSFEPTSYRKNICDYEFYRQEKDY